MEVLATPIHKLGVTEQIIRDGSIRAPDHGVIPIAKADIVAEDRTPAIIDRDAIGAMAIDRIVVDLRVGPPIGQLDTLMRGIIDQIIIELDIIAAA